MAQEQKIMLPPDVNTQQLMMILNHVYPVGSYYETSDENFDPNVSWVGTWHLEIEGQVHVSSGVNYPIVGALTNASDGGEAKHTLTVNEMPSHTHIQNQHRHSMTDLFSGGSGGSNARYVTTSSRTNTTKYTQYTTPTNQNTGGGAAHNNMQPYIAVNRWHRVA